MASLFGNRRLTGLALLLGGFGAILDVTVFTGVQGVGLVLACLPIALLAIEDLYLEEPLWESPSSLRLAFREYIRST